MNRTLLKLYYVGPLAVWMVVIFALSTRAGSSDNSLGMVSWFLKTFSPDYYSHLNAYQLAAHNYLFRKTCHVTEYALLALLAVRALQTGSADLKPRAFLGAAALTVVYAGLDEFHQAFAGNRTASPLDVLIDSAGAFVCLAGILLFFGIKRLERTLKERAKMEEQGPEISPPIHAVPVE